jgi:putative addiction module component (TIGR02574 family)
MKKTRVIEEQIVTILADGSTWAAEINRRVADLDAGTVKPIRREQVRGRLLDRLNERWVVSDQLLPMSPD